MEYMSLKSRERMWKKPKPALNLVMMKLLGIDGEPEVPRNMRFEKGRMTWENLLRLYYIKEERIDKPDPLFEPVSTYGKNTISFFFIVLAHW